MDSTLKEARGLLFYGPAGTGKADMARALADQLSAVFINRMASDLSGEAGFMEIEAEAAGRAAVLFVEGLDVASDLAGLRRSVDALITRMDALASRKVLVVASVSRPDRLDPALLRDGRFTVQVPVGLPDVEERLSLLHDYTHGLSLASDANLTVVARETGGLSADQLKEVSRGAAAEASRRGAFVTLSDFREALERWSRAQQRKPVMDGVERFITAYHEAGHALLSHVLPHAEPLRKVTILPHGLNALASRGVSLALTSASPITAPRETRARGAPPRDGITWSLVIRGLENRPKSVPMTFSFRGNLDIRHRPPDRMGQGVAEIVGDNPLRQGFLSPGAARTAPSAGQEIE